MSDPTPRILFPPEVRRYVYERDNFTCVACGKTHQQARLTIDHIIPVSKGGSNDLSNLQTLCFTCNRLKSNHADPRFRRRYSD
ncbi:MAG: HNH endonuclease [Phormidium sp.]